MMQRTLIFRLCCCWPRADILQKQEGNRSRIERERKRGLGDVEVVHFKCSYTLLTAGMCAREAATAYQVHKRKSLTGHKKAGGDKLCG